MAESGSNSDNDQLSSSPSPFDESSVQRRRHILIVEDNQADVFLILESIEPRLDAILHVVHDGEKAIKFWEQADFDPSPGLALVILDINLPRKDGRDVLNAIRQSRRGASAPVLVVTSSDSERDREDMAKLGVKVYFRKPSHYAEYMKLGEIVKSLLNEIPETSSH